MTTPPQSEIQTIGPPPGPAIAMSWRVDPPESHLEGPSQTLEDPSP
jgi:hypothetical protein